MTLVKDAIISLKVDQSLKAEVSALAKAENRSLSNFIEKVLKAEVAKTKAKGRHEKGTSSRGV